MQVVTDSLFSFKLAYNLHSQFNLRTEKSNKGESKEDTFPKYNCTFTKHYEQSHILDHQNKIQWNHDCGRNQPNIVYPEMQVHSKAWIPSCSGISLPLWHPIYHGGFWQVVGGGGYGILPIPLLWRVLWQVKAKFGKRLVKNSQYTNQRECPLVGIQSPCSIRYEIPQWPVAYTFKIVPSLMLDLKIYHI